MTGHTNSVPKIRFNDFSGTCGWETKNLDSIFFKIRNAFVGTATPYYVDSGNFYLQSNNVKNGQINRETEVFINDKFYKKQKDKWLHTGDLVMVQSGHVGHTAVIEEEYDGIAAHALIMFQKYKNKTDPYFLNFQFQTEEAKRKLNSITTGNTIKHILASEMKDFEVHLPKIEEQQKIGYFFRQLDELITFQQRKIEKTKALMAAYLSEMFPAKGEFVPKRRFSGFTQEWEVKKLRELAGNFEYGLNASATSFDGINKYIRITDIDDQARIFNQSALTSPDAKLFNAENYVLKKGDILFARTGASVGKTYRYRESDGKVYYAGFLIRARIDSQFDSGFVFQSTLTKQYYDFVRITSQRSGQPGINAQEYSQFNLMVPALEEQRKIGNFFKQLDDIITHHKSKLEKLQNLKKAYLHEMFV